jgi:hypothetical protein
MCYVRVFWSTVLKPCCETKVGAVSNIVPHFYFTHSKHASTILGSRSFPTTQGCVSHVCRSDELSSLVVGFLCGSWRHSAPRGILAVHNPPRESIVVRWIYGGLFVVLFFLGLAVSKAQCEDSIKQAVRSAEDAKAGVADTIDKATISARHQLHDDIGIK